MKPASEISADHEKAKKVPHFCHTDGCMTVIDNDIFFCVKCLAKLPKELQQEHRNHVGGLVHWMDRNAHDYTPMIQACVAFLNKKK